MANSLYERFGGDGTPSPTQPAQQAAPQGNAALLSQIRANPRAYVSEIKSDPAGFLRKCGYPIPDGMNDPRQIIGHLFGWRGR